MRFWIFNVYISVRQENSYDCDDFNFDEILWGINYVFILYLQQLYFKCILDFFDIYLCSYNLWISSWTFVSEDRRAVHVRKDMLKTCMLTLIWWRAKYGETVRRIFTSWFGTYCIYICFIWFDASTKNLFVCFHYHVLFFVWLQW